MAFKKGVFVINLMIIIINSAWSSNSNEPMPYYLLEELPADTLIANIAVDAKLFDKYDADTMKLLEYRVYRQVDENGLPVDLFSIGEKNSIVKTNVRIDRDVICPKLTSCIVYLDIAVSPAEYSEVIPTKVDILDINDHVPQFPETEIYRKVLESGTRISLPVAVDPDSSAYSIQHYELVSSANLFELEEPSRDSEELALIIKGTLSRNEASFYQFKIFAYDGGNPPKFGSVLVNIEVGDETESDPKFDNTTYEVFVMENAPIGTTIGRVNAHDLDFGDTAIIFYSFSPETLDNYGQEFGIVEETGAVFTKESLDFEVESSYTLYIQAVDTGSESLPAHATVIVKVEDDNDHTPKISINTLNSPEGASISENSEVGTVVAHVSVTDQDTGENGRAICSIGDAGSSIFQLEEMYEMHYRMITAATLNRESQRDFLVSVTCHDLGKNPLSSTSKLSVTIVDANDHAPRFSHSSYMVSIDENNQVGDVVTVVTASDPDEGPNGDVRYTIHDEAADAFGVHPRTGLITANVELDHETMHTVEIKVIAYDLGKPVPLSSTATILLTIIDVDDEAPKFTQDVFPFGVYENLPPNSEVGAVTAVDADSFPNNMFKYRFLEPRSEAGRTFSINPSTGMIYTREVLDREHQPVYYMTVLAESSTEVVYHSSTVTATVYVADKNDNIPQISWPSEKNNTVFISNETPSEQEIARILASDEDLGENSKLEYSIMSGDEQGVFSINQATGVLAVKDDISDLSYEDFVLGIMVKDQGFPQNMVSATINIIVNNSISYEPPVNVAYKNNNTTIIITLTSASLVLIFLLIIAIVLIKKQAKEKKQKTYANETNPKKIITQKNEAQTMLSAREDTPDGHESVVTDWTPSARRGHSNLATSATLESCYQENIKDINTDIRLSIADNNVNMKTENMEKANSPNHQTVERPTTIDIDSVLKQLTPPGVNKPRGTSTFSSPLTSPQCLTLRASPSLDDPVLREVKGQHLDNMCDTGRSAGSDGFSFLKSSKNNLQENHDKNISQA